MLPLCIYVTVTPLMGNLFLGSIFDRHFMIIPFPAFHTVCSFSTASLSWVYPPLVLSDALWWWGTC